MHYGSNYFAIEKNKPTITDKRGNIVGPSDDFTPVYNNFFAILFVIQDTSQIIFFY